MRKTLSSTEDLARWKSSLKTHHHSESWEMTNSTSSLQQLPTSIRSVLTFTRKTGQQLSKRNPSQSYLWNKFWQILSSWSWNTKVKLMTTKRSSSSNWPGVTLLKPLREIKATSCLLINGVLSTTAKNRLTLLQDSLNSSEGKILSKPAVVLTFWSHSFHRTS